MALARAVGADDDVETSGEGQIGLLEDREIPDPERLKHQLALPPLKQTSQVLHVGIMQWGRQHGGTGRRPQAVSSHSVA